MTNVWPVTLPKAMLAEGYSEQFQENAIRFQPEVGPAKMRRRGTAAGRVIEGAIVVKQSLRDVFDDFYETTLSHGTDTFYWHDAGNGPGTYAFNAPPSYSCVAPGTWRIALQLIRYA